MRGGRIGFTLVFIWAAPNSLIGALIGLVGVATGGRVRRCGPTLEFWGGILATLLRHAPFVPGGASAITFGHVILYRTDEDRERCRRHELIHVRQYEHWGPFFLPAYLAASLVLLLRRKDPYRDNPFEREAYAVRGADEKRVEPDRPIG